MIWDKEEHKLFVEWCHSGTTEGNRTRIYNILYPTLFQMAKATIKKRFKGAYKFEDETNHIINCLNDILINSIGKYDVNVSDRSFSYIHQSMIYYFIYLLYVEPNLNRNIPNRESNQIREVDHAEYAGYDNLFPDEGSDNTHIEYEDVISHFKTLLINKKAEVVNRENIGNFHSASRLKHIEYLEYVVEFISRHHNVNAHDINHYIFHQYGWNINELVVKSRQYLKAEGNFQRLKNYTNFN